jgi:hypothetical protein
MPKYGIKRDAEGRRIGLGPLNTALDEPVNVPKAVSPTLPGAQRTVFECVACEVAGKNQPPRFKLKAIFANHFKKDHQDLYADKDSWRNYCREVVLED